MRKIASAVVVWLMLAAGFVAAWYAHSDLWLTRIDEGLTTTTRVWNLFVAVPLAVVLAGLLAAALLNGPELARALSSRRAIAGANVALTVVLAGGIAVIVNVIASRHYRVLDWTFKAIYSISERSENVVENLHRKVTAHVIGPSFHQHQGTVRGVLDRLRAVAPEKLEVEVLDATRDRDRTQRALLALGVNPKDLDDFEEDPLVIFASSPPGAPQPRTKYVKFSDVVDLDYSGGARRPKLRGFKAEDLFIEAILDVAREKQATVTFLTGHGELEESASREEERIALFAKALRRLDFRVETFAFDFGPESARAKLPADCDVLAIVGARQRFDDRELAELRALLDRGGRLLVCGEPILKRRGDTGSFFFDDTRLNLLLKDYGLQLEPAYVFDEGTALPIGEFSLSPTVQDLPAEHPIMKPLKGLRILFNDAQPVVVDPSDPDSKARPQAILDTSAGALAIRDMDKLRRTRDAYRSDARKGPITLAAVSTRDAVAPTGTAAAAPTGTAAPRREARLVVVGDANVVSDEGVGTFPQNLDFAVNAIAWLSAREETIAAEARPPEVIRLRVNDKAKTRVLLLSLLELPLACALIGLAVYWIRKS